LRIDRTGRQRPRSGWLGKLLLIVLLLGLGAAAGWGWLQYGDRFMRLQVKAATVEVRMPGMADSVLSAQGYLKSEKQAAIGAKVAGRVLKVYVKEGKSVQANDVLAELEHADIDQTLAAMQASLDASKESLDAMRVSLEKSEDELREMETTFEQDRRDFARTEQLFRSRGTSGSDFERAESKLKGSQSRYDSMEKAVRLSKARLREAEARLRESESRYRETAEQRENLFVRAPFNGVVISKEAEEGESIMPGGMGAASGRGSVVTLADLLHLEVETDVKEDYVSRVKRDQKVSVAVDAVPNRRFGGKVLTIIPMGDRAKGTVKVKVQLDESEVREVNDPDTSTFTLFPEMAATVHFMSEGKEAQRGEVIPQVFAPAAAVRKGDSGQFVWQIVEDRVRRVAVEADVEVASGGERVSMPMPDADSKNARSSNGKVRIDRGLKGGERVVIDPPEKFEEGMLVKVLP
jgi:multidrug efflux pump subunit AcrA (membrane-fusion protein)